MPSHRGGCLCGHITYQVEGKPSFPHLCSCSQCQKWSGALTVAWVEFPLEGLNWDGPGGEPKFFRSSEKTKRGSCPECGAALCALDDGYDKVSFTIASLENPAAIRPGKQHSFKKTVPDWWQVEILR